MTVLLLAYPRLSTGETQIIHQRMIEKAEQDQKQLVDLVAYSHPRAQPVPTGASIADEAQIASVRAAVIEDLGPWLTGNQPVPRSQTAAFDRALGKSLHEHLRIVPADAGHDSTWNFLSAVVFPDLVWARFPDLHVDRVQGKRHRNTLRRAWFRHTIVGDLQQQATRPLGEDEMTGLFERPTLAMNYSLIRLLAQMVLDYEERDRMTYTRRLTKRAIALTGTYLLDTLSEDEIHGILDPSYEPPSAHNERPRAVESPETENTASTSLRENARTSPSATVDVARSRKPAGHESSDLVGAFHREMVDLCNRIEIETGQRPNELFWTVVRLGGLEAARSFVGAQRPSKTFTLLWERRRGDLTVESLVLADKFRGLFSEALLDRAADRLEEAFEG